MLDFSGADLANVVNIAAIKASQVLVLADEKARKALKVLVGAGRMCGVAKVDEPVTF